MQLRFPESKRAPGRGRYERARSGSERFRAQRERLLRATAIAHLEGAESVSRVTALSGVGRNTFYECFDDFAHALATVRRAQLQRVRRALNDARDAAGAGESAQGVAVLCRAWLELIAAQPVTALVTLEPVCGEQASALTSAFREAVAPLLPSSTDEGPAEGPLFHAAVCAEASGRTLALALLTASPDPTAPAEADTGEASVPNGRDAPILSVAALTLVRSVRALLGV